MTKLYRIISGIFRVKVNNKEYVITSPTPEILYQAELYYDEILEENKFDPWASDDDVVKLLISNKEWTNESDENLVKISEQIDEYKHKAYLAYTSMQFAKVKEFKRLAKESREKESSMRVTRNKYFHLTLEGHAEIVKREFILSHCINGYKPETLPFPLLDNIQSKINRQLATLEEIRLLARTEPWLSIWTSYKQNPARIFTNKFYNDEQKSLITYSQMYDNIIKHPERPAEAVIGDDDLLDGWLIEQKKGDKKKDVKKIKGKGMDKAQELFVFVDKNNKEMSVEQQIKEIEDMNSSESKVIKKQRNAVIKKAGSVADNRLPDKQKEIASKLSANYIEHMRGLKRRK